MIKYILFSSQHIQINYRIKIKTKMSIKFYTDVTKSRHSDLLDVY
jgi:hypothetical protein